MGVRADSKLMVGHKELTSLFRAWGWNFHAQGVKEVRFKKNGYVVGFRKVNAGFGTYGPVIEAARVDGVLPDVWLDGPPKKEHTLQTEREVHVTPLEPLTGDASKVATPIEPLPVTPDLAGYITLQDALNVRGMKKNELNRTSAEIIVALSNGDIVSSDGKATSILHSMLPAAHREKPIGLSAITMQLKAWEDANLIWRKINGRRCLAMGLTMPVKVTPEEVEEYARSSKPIITVEPTHRDEAGPDHGLDKDTCLLCRPPRQPEPPEPDITQVPELHPEPTHEPASESATGQVDVALEILQREHDELLKRLESLELAINILKKADR